MATRPENIDPEAWRAQRAAHYRRINWTLNILMLIAVIAVLIRYLG